MQGNLIGTNKDGTTSISGNFFGVFIENGASNNLIGGTSGTTPGGSCTGACNLISGQPQADVQIRNNAGALPSGNNIQGNFRNRREWDERYPQ